MRDEPNGSGIGWFTKTWAQVRAHVPELAELSRAVRDSLFGTSLGAATALMTYFTVSQGFRGLLPARLAKSLQGSAIQRPDFYDLALVVGGFAVLALIMAILGWFLKRLFISWWHGAFRGILLIWWLTTALWLYQSKGVFRPQLLWPALPLLFTIATVMAHRSRREE